MALRAYPPLPATIRRAPLVDYRAQNVADSVLYREATALAPRARGWSVHWYETKAVFSAAARALGRDDIDALLQDTGRPRPAVQKDPQAGHGGRDRQQRSGLTSAAPSRLRLHSVRGRREATAEDVRAGLQHRRYLERSVERLIGEPRGGHQLRLAALSEVRLPEAPRALRCSSACVAAARLETAGRCAGRA
jgi:hypothetical protein